MTTLQAFDTALLVVVDAENRAGLAEQMHPVEALPRCRPDLRTGSQPRAHRHLSR